MKNAVARPSIVIPQVFYTGFLLTFSRDSDVSNPYSKQQQEPPNLPMRIPKPKMMRVRLSRGFILLGCVLGLFCLPGTSRAALLSTTANQGSSATTGWNAAIWRTNVDGVLTGVTLSPVAGNTYSCVTNGVAFGASTANTIIRNPFVSGQAPIQTFPGDSLTLTNDTEIRFKRIGSGNVPTCDFPGVGGNPGLILRGGLLNPGDDDTYPITGLIRVEYHWQRQPGIFQRQQPGVPGFFRRE
jgi:hypothetical protein